jgi:lysophospholipase L1-like esterase
MRIQLSRPSRRLLIVLWMTVLCLSKVHAEVDEKGVLPGVQRILFLGDSITHSGQYIDDLETQFLLLYPNRHVEFINCGLSSETVSGLSEDGHADGKFPRPDLHERLDRVLAKVQPDLIFACYGMNDGIYLPLSDERFAKFKDGMNRLHDKVIATGAKIIHLTPPVFDPAPIRAKVVPAERVDANHPFEGYNGVLDAYANWLLEQRKQGWRVIDLHGAIQEAIAEKRKADAGFTFSRDGVHPDAAGHRVMANAVLRGLDLPLIGESADPPSKFARVSKLVRERNRILTDAWLTYTGHKRPMKAGLPMDEARQKAAMIERAITEALGRP